MVDSLQRELASRGATLSEAYELLEGAPEQYPSRGDELATLRKANVLAYSLGNRFPGTRRFAQLRIFFGQDARFRSSEIHGED
jgi:hypothetical protein